MDVLLINEGKLEPKARKCVFLGCSSGVKGYKVWCPYKKGSKFMFSWDVTFDEFSMLKGKSETMNSSIYYKKKYQEQVDFEIVIQPNQPSSSTLA